MQDVVNELKASIEGALAKFEAVEKQGMSSELAVVKTHLETAKTRIEQELAKYVAAPTAETAVPQRTPTAVTDDAKQDIQDQVDAQKPPATPETTDTSRDGELASNTPSAQTQSEPEGTSETESTESTGEQNGQAGSTESNA